MRPILWSQSVVSGFILTLAINSALNPGTCRAEAPSLEHIDSLLQKGQLKSAERDLSEWLSEHPDDSSRQLALGVVRLTLAFEATVRDLREHGAKIRFGPRGILVAGDVKNAPKDPPRVSYQDARRLVRRFGKRVAKAQQAFAKADNPAARFPIHLAAIRVDLSGNETGTDGAQIGALTRLGAEPDALRDVVILLDQTDALWLDAHCHSLLALTNFLLAYDWSETFEHLGHVLFWRTETAWSDRLGKWEFSGRWEDAITMLHLIRWPLHSKNRMAESHRHAEAFAESFVRATESLQNEKDDDHEFLAGPNQTPTLGPFRLSQEELDQLRGIAKQIRSILKGDLLAPRIDDAIKFQFSQIDTIHRGINVKRFFQEPRKFDLVLLIHGLATTPYLENGTVDLRI